MAITYQSANVFSTQAIKEAKWKYFRYTIVPRDRSIKSKRRVSVYCPIFEAAPIGAGCHQDEIMTMDRLSPLEEFFESSQVRRRVSQIEIVKFLNGLAQNLHAGMAMQHTLQKCAKLAKSPYFRGVLGTMCLYTSKEGAKLSTAMTLFPEAFDDSLIAIIETGEESGRFKEVTDSLAVGAMENYKIAKKIKGLLLYPLILAIALFGVVALIQFFAMPKLLPMFSALMTSKMPLSSRIVMGSSKFVLGNPFMIAVPVVIAGLIVSRWKSIIRHPDVQRHTLKIPVVGDVVKNYIMLRCMRAMALLLRAVAPTDKMYDIVGRVSGNSVFKEYFKRILARVQGGDHFADAFYAERYPMGELGLDVADQLVVAKSSGFPWEALLKGADILQTNLNAKIEMLPTLINVAVLLFFAPFVMLIALSVIEPTLQMATDMLNAGHAH